MAASVPCPSASGASENTIRPLIKPPHRRHDKQQPWLEGRLSFLEERNLAPRMVRAIAGDAIERIVDHDLGRDVEDNRAQAGDKPDDQRQPQQASLWPQAFVAQFEK